MPKSRQAQLKDAGPVKKAARPTPPRPVATKVPPRQTHTLWRLPDGSRSVQSPWVWRGFAFMSFIALGLCLVFAVGGKTYFAVAWAIITIGWFSISMWLWRKHVRDDDEMYALSRGRRGA